MILWTQESRKFCESCLETLPRRSAAKFIRPSVDFKLSSVYKAMQPIGLCWALLELLELQSHESLKIVQILFIELGWLVGASRQRQQTGPYGVTLTKTHFTSFARQACMWSLHCGQPLKFFQAIAAKWYMNFAALKGKSLKNFLKVILWENFSKTFLKRHWVLGFWKKLCAVKFAGYSKKIKISQHCPVCWQSNKT